LIAALFIVYSVVVYAEETRYNVPIGDSPSIGPENAPVTVIEFLDYQ